MLGPAEVRTVTLPERTFVGTRNRMRVFDQLANEEEGITTEPTRTVLLPRDEPKLLPVTVTVWLYCTRLGETDVMRGEALSITSRFVPDVPFEVVTCTLPLRALAGTLTTILLLDQLT